ncbi:transporter [Pelotalea chapellei]|nr:transporter [Pelotalea chapellei]
MLLRRIAVSLTFMVSAFISTPLLAQETPKEEKKIQDNSFLIEEAYNQEHGVVQHIQSFQYMKGDAWLYMFTQEWPVPRETHQLSYTIPVMRLDSQQSSGFGDILLNYRYQAIQKEHIAVAPRFSLVLPTGDYRKGRGTGTVGYQVNIPVSVELNDKFVTHWNLGWTFTPDSKNEIGEKADTLSTNYGASLIYLASPNFNLMLEAAGTSGQAVAGPGTTVSDDTMFINPGMRFAINFKSGLQVVPGLSFPIGVGPSKGEYGVLTYLSFEHPLF